jgi:serine/threonine protein kinase/Flp pilus assembly protein TadD
MIRPKSLVILVLLAVVIWIGYLAVRSGFQAAPFCANLGTSMSAVGARGLATKFLASAVEGYKGQLAALTHSGTPPGGSHAHTTGDRKQAVEAARKQLVEAQCLLAEVYIAGGRYKDAETVLGEAGQTLPGDTKVALLLAEGRLRHGGPERAAQAERTLLAIVARDPDNSRALTLLADAYAAQKSPEAAASYYQKAAAADANDYTAVYRLAKQQIELKRKDEAIKSAERAVAAAETVGEKTAAIRLLSDAGGKVASPSSEVLGLVVKRHSKALLILLLGLLMVFSPSVLNASAMFMRGPTARLYLLTHRRDPRAMSLYRQLLEHRPGDVSVLRVVAAEQGRLHADSPETMRLCEQWFNARPEEPAAAEALARAAMAQRRTDAHALEACRAWFESGVSDAGDLQHLTSFMAAAYMNNGILREDAIPLAELATATGAKDAALLKYLGALYSEFGRAEDALDVLMRAAEAAEDDLDIRELLGRVCIQCERHYLAYRYLRSIPSTDEVDSALYVAGVGLDQAGQSRQALRVFVELARREPSFADVQQRLRRLSAESEAARCGGYELHFVVVDVEAYRVCAATDPAGNEVAVTLFCRDYSDDLSFPRVFEETLPDLAGLRHEGLAEILRYGVDDEEYFVVTEALSGRTVARLLEERGHLTFKESATIIAEVLRTLAYLHETGHTHGDVRPENIVVTPQGSVKLVATGCTSLAARAVGDMHGGRLGSAECIAPEVVQRKHADQRRDIYAAACVFYNMLVGRPPFSAPNRVATMMAHVASQPEPPSQLHPALYGDIDNVVLKALSKEPSRRYESGLEFRAAALKAAGLPDDLHRVTLSTPRQAEETPATGQWWDGFDDVDLIEISNGAKVYRGVDRNARAARAIKELSCPRATGSSATPAAARAEVARKRLFQNEMHLLQALTSNGAAHPGVVKIYDVWPPRSGMEAAYSMELLARTLEFRLADGPIPPNEAHAIMTSLCEAVGHLHAQGIVHRNITPRGVMFDNEGNVRLVGFDRACRLADKQAVIAAEADIQAIAASPAEAMGDAAYMSPEQCRADDFDARTDVYSLGCVFYHMLAGRPPFVGDDCLAVMLKQLSETAPAVTSLGVKVQPGVENFLERALGKDPESRFRDGQEAAETLGRLGGQAPAKKTSDQPQHRANVIRVIQR